MLLLRIDSGAEGGVVEESRRCRNLNGERRSVCSLGDRVLVKSRSREWRYLLSSDGIRIVLTDLASRP